MDKLEESKLVETLIHPVHRRLADIVLKHTGSVDSKNSPVFSYECMTMLPYAVLKEIAQCLAVNADFVYRIDALKNLAFHAHTMGDMAWQQDLSGQIDELQAKCKVKGWYS